MSSPTSATHHAAPKTEPVPEPVSPPVQQQAQPAKSNTKMFVLLGCGCLVLLIICIVVGYFLLRNVNFNNILSTSTTTIEQAQSKQLKTADDRKTFLANFVKNYEGNKQFSMTGDYTTSISGTSYTLTMKLVLDNKNSEIDMSTAGSSKKLQMLSIDGVSYLSDGSGKWYQLPASESSSSMVNTTDLTGLDKNFGPNAVDGKDYTYTGVAKCGDAYCHLFKVSNSDSSSSTLAIGIDDSLLHQVIADASTGASTFTVSNDKVTLTKPANVQVLGNDAASLQIITGIYTGLFGL